MKKHQNRTFKFSAWLVAILVLQGVTYQPARAIPIFDAEINLQWAANLVEKGLDFAAQAAVWRDKLVDKVDARVQQVEELVRLRKRIERNAVGELGTVGGLVPDWVGDNRPYCELTYDGVSVCDVNSYLNRRFESVVMSTYHEYRRKGFSEMREFRENIHEHVGGRFAVWGESLGEGAGDYIEPEVAASEPYMVAQAENATRLEQAAFDLNMLVDSLMTEEVEGVQLSSGRAQQLTAHLAYVEALVELEVTKARLTNLQAVTVQAADRVRGHRVAEVAKRDQFFGL